MLRIPVVFAVVLLLIACGQASDDQGPSTSQVVPPPPTSDGVRTAGKQAYDQACARCHDEGLDGAPRTGDREAWAGRSWLWEAVLFEHAKNGYMTMPAKGGEEGLDDTMVEMAAEYMLSVTFPDANPAN